MQFFFLPYLPHSCFLPSFAVTKGRAPTFRQLQLISQVLLFTADQLYVLQ